MTVPPAPRVTLMDVARRAGVSRTTASFVTTGRRDMRISVDAQERVLRAARELNYRPSLLARSLRTNRSQTIGLLSDGIATDAYAGEMIRGSLTTALLHEHMLFIAETAGDAELEKQLIKNMLDRGVGGFLYASMYTRRVRISTALRAHPLVLLNCVARTARTRPRSFRTSAVRAGRRRGCCCVTGTATASWWSARPPRMCSPVWSGSPACSMSLPSRV